MNVPTTTPLRIEHTYGASTPYSIGVEEEFQLVHRESFDLVSRVDVILDLANERDRERIKPELMQSVVESATKVCRNAAEAEEDLVSLRRRLVELADQSDCCIASSGTHPFSRYEFQKVTERERYNDIMSRLKWVAQRELIFGLHVHVGMDSPEKAIAVFNHVRSYIPQMLALSTNSPFWQGRATGLHSSRIKVFDSFPRSGLPQEFVDWQHWLELMQRAMKVGALADYTYVWWDVRPHPRFGTVEVRVMDAQTRVQNSAALAALVQATCAWLGEQFDKGTLPATDPQMLINENKWSATRYGLDGALIDFTNDTTLPTRDAVQALIERVEPYARRLGSQEQFSRLDGIVDHGTGAERQLAWYGSSESLMSVAEMLVRETNEL